jgi:hypothetical protein
MRLDGAAYFGLWLGAWTSSTLVSFVARLHDRPGLLGRSCGFHTYLVNV